MVGNEMCIVCPLPCMPFIILPLLTILHSTSTPPPLSIHLHIHFYPLNCSLCILWLSSSAPSPLILCPFNHPHPPPPPSDTQTRRGSPTSRLTNVILSGCFMMWQGPPWRPMLSSLLPLTSCWPWASYHTSGLFMSSFRWVLHSPFEWSRKLLY